jgi:hypothetical protein
MLDRGGSEDRRSAPAPFRIFRLLPIPFRHRRISPCSILRHGPLAARRAGSEHGERKGPHVSTRLTGAFANISKIKFWKYF